MSLENLERYISKQIKKLPQDSLDRSFLKRMRGEVTYRLRGVEELPSGEQISYREMKQNIQRVLGSKEGTDTVMFAHEEAYNLRSRDVNSIHLLLGLIRQGDLTEVLAQNGLSYAKVRSFTEFIYGYGGIADLDLTPKTFRVIQEACKGVRSGEEIAPSHLLRTVLEEKDGPIAPLLDCLHIDTQKLKADIS